MLTATRFAVVEMSGTPYEMGLAHGKRCQALIKRLVRKFDDMMMPAAYHEAGREVVRGAMPIVQREAPDLYEETEGIAAGAGMSVEDIFRLNCASEVHAWRGCKDLEAVTTVPDGCTSFAVEHEGSSLVAWNMDWWRIWQPFLVLLHGQPAQGPRFRCVAFAGCVGRPGISERIGVSANYLPYRAAASIPSGRSDWAGPGVPYNYMTRMLLQQTSTPDALKLLERVPRMLCLNYTIGDSQGRIACVEALPHEMAVLKPTEGFLVHANSYHSPKLDGLTEEQQKTSDPRAYLARQILRERGMPLQRADIYVAQRAHFPGADTGVCVHTVYDKPSMTLLSFVADVAKQTLWVAYGSPCEHRFLPYRPL
ncbi:C45 family autoproteolytic acyltransferase/hydrolase [bacterium]|nr:C45 family autoproteolytic acyltransferase/hydrolase [bacterium]